MSESSSGIPPGAEEFHAILTKINEEPLCRECKHHSLGACRVRVDVVSGVTATCKTERYHGKCGLHGRYFEMKHNA